MALTKVERETPILKVVLMVFPGQGNESSPTRLFRQRQHFEVAAESGAVGGESYRRPRMFVRLLSSFTGSLCVVAEGDGRNLITVSSIRLLLALPTS